MTTSIAIATPPEKPAAPNSSTKPRPNSQQNAQEKKTPRRSKPIINWFQRKLAGTGRAKRVESGSQNGVRSPGFGRPTNRVASSPLPSAASSHVNRPQGRFETLTDAKRKTISLNGDDDTRGSSISNENQVSDDDESLARGSAWSPRSVIEADEDASVRPLPPSSPPSPSPSRSSSSYLSDPRTFKSIAASTKPTTLLSIDLHGNGMAHIAEAPVTPNSQLPRLPHVRTSSTSTAPNVVGSGASITFSALPPSPQSSSRPSSTATAPQNTLAAVQAPLHTTHHPRNNPRPSSPPMDNASMLTLASSAYAIPGLRVGMGMPIGWSSAPPSAVGGGTDSVSQFEADVESQNDEEQFDDRDVNASLRALRPRSTRRGSWESEASRWSARMQVGTPSLARDRSIWTTNSIRTGALSTDHVDMYEKSDEAATGESSPDGDEPSTAEDVASPTSVASDSVDANAPQMVDAPQPNDSQQSTDRSVYEHQTSADTLAQVDKTEREGEGEVEKSSVTSVSESDPSTANLSTQAMEEQRTEKDDSSSVPKTGNST